MSGFWIMDRSLRSIRWPGTTWIGWPACLTVFTARTTGVFWQNVGTCDINLASNFFQCPFWWKNLQFFGFSTHFCWILGCEIPSGYLWLEESTRDLGPWSLWPGRYQGGVVIWDGVSHTKTSHSFAEDRIREFIAVGVLRGSMQGWKGWKIFVRKSRENFPQEIVAIMDKLRRFGMIFSLRLHVVMVATIE